MTVLITGAASDLGRAVTTQLRRRRQRLRLTDRRRLRTDLDFTQSQLGHSRQTDALVAGIKAIVHIPGPGGTQASAADWIDTCTRGTYNLLVAAAAAGVEHCVYLGSLDSFTAYDEDMRVTPGWQPRPTAEPAVMAPHLGEFVAKEFAHTGQLRLTVLRLGHLVDADGVGADDALDPVALDPRDAGDAVAAALKSDAGDQAYRVFHVQGDFAGARFRNIGRRRLDFHPRYDFGRPRQEREPGS